MNGAKSPGKTDWSGLKGRRAVIATDHDEPGRAFGDAVCSLLREAGTAEVWHLRPDRLGSWVWRDGERIPRGEPIPEGYDLADALAEGWTVEALASLRMDPAFFTPYRDATEEEAAMGNPPRSGSPAVSGSKSFLDRLFRVGPYGVAKQTECRNQKTGEADVEWRWVCSEIEVVAETRNVDGEEWGRLLCITDRDGRRKEWSMPMAMLAGDGTGYRERLLSIGLVMAPGRFARDALHEFISTAQPHDKARCVTRVGWHGTAFVLPDCTIGETQGERILLQTSGVLDHAFRTRGTLDSWQEQIACHAVGNSRLALALAAAFAAPLLQLNGGESGGFHYRGASSSGKSTTLIAGGSAWGGGNLRGYVRQWRATDNGLEGVALAHCDTLVCLDELSQIDAKAVGPAAYMLANGVGKVRATWGARPGPRRSGGCCSCPPVKFPFRINWPRTAGAERLRLDSKCG
jgi:hypothetical protein